MWPIMRTMTRKPVTPTTEAATLLSSRRRCCICFGLNRDTSLKQGQIAHLDGNSANSIEDNLAFLCFDHHDRYDSTTSQSKNFTLMEVKQFRAELYAEIDLAFRTEVRFGNAQGVVDQISGHYIREGDYESADIKVDRMADGRYHISGLALWGKGRNSGPHTGQLDFIAEMNGRKIEYVHFNSDGQKYRAVLSFSDDGLTVTEVKRDVSIFGINVSFTGEYTKAMRKIGDKR
jgi:hypothetical protein